MTVGLVDGGGLGCGSLGTSAKGRQEPQERVTVRRQGLAPRPGSNHRPPATPVEHATPGKAESSQWLRLASVFMGSACQLPPSCVARPPDADCRPQLAELITCSPACLINLVRPGLKRLSGLSGLSVSARPAAGNRPIRTIGSPLRSRGGHVKRPEPSFSQSVCLPRHAASPHVRNHVTADIRPGSKARGCQIRTNSTQTMARAYRNTWPVVSAIGKNKCPLLLSQSY
jgi:hypothetical protein